VVTFEHKLIVFELLKTEAMVLSAVNDDNSAVQALRSLKNYCSDWKLYTKLMDVFELLGF
jgi:hypothetical protein